MSKVLQHNSIFFEPAPVKNLQEFADNYRRLQTLKVNQQAINKAADILWMENKLRCEFYCIKEHHQKSDDALIIARAERFLKMGLVREEFVEQLKADME